MAVTLVRLSARQVPALVQCFCRRGYGYAIGFVFFGGHCLILGYLVFTSGFGPKVLGILLLVAGAGYWVDGLGRTLLPRYNDFATIFAVAVFTPAFIGELSFCLWLLAKGPTGPVARSPSLEAAR